MHTFLRFRGKLPYFSDIIIGGKGSLGSLYYISNLQLVIDQ